MDKKRNAGTDIYFKFGGEWEEQLSNQAGNIILNQNMFTFKLCSKASVSEALTMDDSSQTSNLTTKAYFRYNLLLY